MQYANEAQQFLEDLLRKYKEEGRKLKKEITTLPEGQLTKRIERGKLNYVQLIRVDGTQRRIGITHREDIVAGLARKKYVQISLEKHLSAIKHLEKLVKHNQQLTPNGVLETLPKAYKTLPESLFFPKRAAGLIWIMSKTHTSRKNGAIRLLEDFGFGQNPRLS